MNGENFQNLIINWNFIVPKIELALGKTDVPYALIDKSKGTNFNSA